MYLAFVLLVLAQTQAARSGVDVVTLGARPDGTNSAATTKAFQLAFTTQPHGKILVPPGSYLIDNSAGPLTISNFSGTLLFQPDAQLVFTDNAKGGLLFEGGSGAVIAGLNATYAQPPAVRNSPNEEIKFSRTVNTVLRDALVRNSPAAGILFFGSISPRVTNATVIDSLADGLNFSNCRDAQVRNLRTQNTGDDGLAFVNYLQYPSLVGGFAQNIVIVNSKARGIAVAGQSDVTVDGFQVQNTSSSGVLVAQDVANHTRIPNNVEIKNGTVENAGTLTPLVGNQYGIEFNSQVSVLFSNIRVSGSGNNGLSGSSANGSVTVSNVAIESPLHGLGFLFYQTRTVRLSSSSASNTPSYGFLSLKSQDVIVSGLTVTNAGVTDPLKRSVWFEDAETILATNIKISSGAGTANSIGCYTSPGHSAASGSVKILTPSKAVSVLNDCPQVILGF